MVIGKHTLLYIIETDHPLWLTKDIMAYVGGKDLLQCIDWIRSGRNCLYVKKQSAVEQIKQIHFFYPDGTIFLAREKENNSNVDDTSDSDSSLISPLNEDFYFDF
nr:lef-6 [Pieris rapae granulovirus]